MFGPFPAPKVSSWVHGISQNFNGIFDGIATDFRRFREKFQRFREVFRGFRKFFEVFGPVRTCSDLFGCVRMRADASGRVQMHSDSVEDIRKNRSKNLFCVIFARFWAQAPISADFVFLFSSNLFF